MREDAEAAPAKINLALHVIGRRADGYHELESLVIFAGVGDELHARPAPTDTLIIDGPFAAGLDSGPTNLVMRAVAAFRERWPGSVGNGVALRLTKNLPVASGIGGGSADAAAALRLLKRQSTSPVLQADLIEIGARLGADVPVCLLSRPAEMRGIGERVTPLPQFPSFHLVLVNPMQAVSTPEVFRNLAQRDNGPLPALPDPLSDPEQLTAWLAETRNDLQPPAIALVGAIGDLIEQLAQTPGCMLARMSGSGATVFGLFASGAEAKEAADQLQAEWPNFWVAAAPVVLP